MSEYNISANEVQGYKYGLKGRIGNKPTKPTRIMVGISLSDAEYEGYPLYERIISSEDYLKKLAYQSYSKMNIVTENNNMFIEINSKEFKDLDKAIPLVERFLSEIYTEYKQHKAKLSQFLKPISDYVDKSKENNSSNNNKPLSYLDYNPFLTINKKKVLKRDTDGV